MRTQTEVQRLEKPSSPSRDRIYHCFVSYARTDMAFAQRLRTGLLSRQLEPWIDLEGLLSGEAFWPVICKYIEGSETFVFVMTGESVRRPWCLRELAYAVEHNKRILPVMAGQFDAAAVQDLPVALKSRQWTFMREGDDFEAALDGLAKAILTDPPWIRTHTRLLVRAREWKEANRSKSFALRGEDLNAAERWLADSHGKEPQPGALHAEHIIASRKHATAFRNVTLGAVTTGLVVALSLAIVAYAQRQEAVRQRDLAQARQLATESELRRRERDALLPLSTSLAVRSLRVVPTAEGAQALRDSMTLLPLPVANFRHDSVATGVVFSSDGSRLATTSRDGTIRIWSLADRSEIRRFDVGAVAEALQFSADGMSLSAAVGQPAGQGGNLRGFGSLVTWDLSSGKELQRIDVGHDLRAAAFDRTGRYLATGSGAGGTLWDLAHAKPVGCFASPGISSLSFGSDRILVGKEFNRAEIWESGECKAAELDAPPPARSRRLPQAPAPPGHEIVSFPNPGQVVAVAYSPRLDVVATSAWDSKAKVWSVDEQRVVTELVHQGRIRDIAFSSTGDLIATAGEDSTARVWDLASGREIARVSHESWVLAVRFNPQGTLVATAGEDGEVRVWETRGAREQHRLPHQDMVSALSFSPDNRYLATAESSGAIWLWDRTTSGRVDARMAHQKQYSVSSLAFSSDGRLLASAGQDYGARVWKVPTGEALFALKHRGSVSDIVFNQDDTLIATASQDGHARVWDATAGELLHSFPHGQHVTRVIFGRNDRRNVLATASTSETKEFDVETGRELVARPHQGLRTMAYSPDGREVATGGADGRVLLWQAGGDAPPRMLLHMGSVRLLAYSLDGSYLATESAGEDAPGGDLTLWETSSGRQVFRSVHQGVVWDLAFSPDGAYVATAQTDNTTRLWSVADGSEAARLDHAGRVSAVTFSPDGRYLGTGSWDRTAQLWLWRYEDLVEAACERLVRDTAIYARTCDLAGNR